MPKSRTKSATLSLWSGNDLRTKRDVGPRSTPEDVRGPARVLEMPVKPRAEPWRVSAWSLDCPSGWLFTVRATDPNVPEAEAWKTGRVHFLLQCDPKNFKDGEAAALIEHLEAFAQRKENERAGMLAGAPARPAGRVRNRPDRGSR